MTGLRQISFDIINIFAQYSNYKNKDIHTILQKQLQLSTQTIELLILFLFFCSGFSGLIYESIWTHYLKLIFGHAAYAQSLVLSIFMGGLAIGAYIVSFQTPKIKKPLLTYAIIEAIIGLFALFFHDFFIFSNNILFNQLAPNIDSSFIFTFLKWSLGILLILPQSILLGTTFPLISNALLKLSPQLPGKKISLLYFNNSFGAAIGALASGFYLIQLYGLPGTMLTAGLINIFIALAVLLIIKYVPSNNTKQKSYQIINRDRFYYLMLAAAFFTGVASFFYEIAWIRMLTLVLGATTHAFELMISAFILGLALGSLWIKKRIDNFKSPVTVLAYVQLLMATFAFFTIISYDVLFDIMEFVFKGINRNKEGYNFYILINHALALVIMLPASIFAGMTLPLITHILLRRQSNKKIIGYVYALNTLGAIVGIVIAMNFLLPLIGTKGLVSLGGLVDICIGLSLLGYLFYKTPNSKLKLQFFLAGIISFAIFHGTYNSNSFDPLKTSAGVFRTGVAEFEDNTKILFHKDGKLSTVDIIQDESGYTIISNNGKPDAGIKLYDAIGGADEVTMILAGALPLSINPNIKNVANIGMGSGQTVQTLLSYPNITHVDTIEIEKSVIEALPFFERHSQLPRYDKRNHIIIDDAKTFFASSKTKYDLIISEPPNLWVSGVSSLFTTEFYSQIKKKLNHDGIFAQWIHLYEINIKTVASIFNALSNNFGGYRLYNTDDGNILIIATDKPISSPLTNTFLSSPKAQQLLQRIQINSIDAFHARYLGNKKLLEPLFKSFSTEIASDYYPSITYDAAKSLFLNDSATSLISLHNYPLPINKILSNLVPNKTYDTQNEKFFNKTTNINIAKSILNEFIHNKHFNNNYYTQQLRFSLKLLSIYLYSCSDKNIDYKVNSDIIIESVHKLAVTTTAYLGKEDLEKLWRLIGKAPCYKKITGEAKSWLTLHKAFAKQNFKEALKISERLFKTQKSINNFKLREYLFSGVLISAIKTNNAKFALTFWQQYSKTIFKFQKDVPMSLRLLHAHIKNALEHTEQDLK